MTKPNEQMQKLVEIKDWLDGGTINAFGRQFGGKDSQLKRLKPHVGGVVIGGGEILRKAKADPSSGVPRETLESMDRGELIDSDDFTRIVFPILKRTAAPGQVLLLSAVGRKLGEEQGVIQATEASGHPTRLVLELDITRDEALRRFENMESRGRDDDTPEGIRDRLTFFDQLTRPVLNIYENMGLLVKVDAMPEEQLVFDLMVNLIHDRATGKG